MTWAWSAEPLDQVAKLQKIQREYGKGHQERTIRKILTVRKSTSPQNPGTSPDKL